MRLSFVFILSFLFSLSLSAQFNIKVGYQYLYSNPTVHNKIINQLNIQNSTLKNYEEMESLHGFHGLSFGARQRFGFVGLNAAMNSKFRRKSYKGNDSSTNASVYRKHFYGFRSYSVGLEFFVKNISFGGSLDLNRFRIRAESNERTDRHTFFQDDNYSSTFFIATNLYGSEHLSLSIQPFVQIPFTKFDFTTLQSELNVDANLDSYEEALMTFGIKIIFQNGFYDKED